MISARVALTNSYGTLTLPSLPSTSVFPAYEAHLDYHAQITQFLFGASYAALHPVCQVRHPCCVHTSIFILSHQPSQRLPRPRLALSQLFPAETYGAILRRILLRAAGDEGVMNVRDKQGNIIMEEAIQKYHERRYKTDYTTIDT